MEESVHESEINLTGAVNDCLRKGFIYRAELNDHSHRLLLTPKDRISIVISAPTHSFDWLRTYLDPF